MTSFKVTTCLDIDALQEHLLQEGDAKLAMSKHPFNIPFGGSSKPYLESRMHLIYLEWVAEIIPVFNVDDHLVPGHWGYSAGEREAAPA